MRSDPRTYRPFDRGRAPVGVHSHDWHDHSRNRPIPTEVWYPATDAYRGADLDPHRQDSFQPGWVLPGDPDPTPVTQAAVRDADVLPGTHPMVLLVHGWAGYRREATFLGTHLASHGYVVVSPDVMGSTYPDVDAFLRGQEPTGPAKALVDHFAAIAVNRRSDVPFLIDQAAKLYDIDSRNVGVTGASFGGWTALNAPSWDDRIAASLPMCPATDLSHAADAPGPFTLDSDWKRDVPTLFCVADRDAILPLYGQLAAFRQTPASWKRMAVLADADHNHFVDDIDTGQTWLAEFTRRVADAFPNGPGNWDVIAQTVVDHDELVPGDVAKTFWQGLATAFFDANLHHSPDGLAVINSNLAEHGARLGATVSVVDMSCASRTA